ncbi:hypothetical protein BC629DRAFT_1487060 [Irpex lacteus]|nr:hypothetical protein BC629DRAFT_1487060 [Irpex lacteus]
MPQAYFTSPKRGQESPPGHRKSPRTHRSGRSSKITSPTPLSPTELANYILERGNTVTSPIIAKMVLDQHLDSRALAEFADESDSEEQFTSLRPCGGFLEDDKSASPQVTTSRCNEKCTTVVKEIASLLEHAEFTAVSPASTAPAFMTPLLSPSIPEWDLEDPNSPEDLEIFAPMQSAMDDSDDDDLLHSPGLRNFPYGISPSSSQGGADGLGDPPGHIQADLLNRRRSPGEDGKAPRTSVRRSQEPSAPVCLERRARCLCSPLPRRPPPQLTYAEAGVQTEVIEVPVVVDQPASHSVEVVSDAEDTSYHDARSTHSTTESVRDTDEETDEFHDLSQSGGEEHTSAPNTPKQSSKSELPADVLTPRASNTPAAAKPVALPVENLQVQRLKADHATSSSSPVAPGLTRTASEPQRTTNKKAMRPPLDTKRAQSSAGSSSSHAPRSAPPQPAPTFHATKPAKIRPPGTTAARKESDTKANEKRSTAKESQHAHVPETSSSSTVVSEVATAHDASASEPIRNPKPAVHPEVHVDDNSKASQESIIAVAESSGDVGPSKSNESEQLTAQVAITSVEPTKIDSLADTVDNSQESTQTSSTAPGDTEQADQQTDTDGEASRSKLGKGKEIEGSNVSTPKPPVKVQLLVGATTGSGGTTPIDELSSEAQEQIGSAMSSSLLPDSTSSEGLSSSESAKERTDDKELADTADQNDEKSIAALDQPPLAPTLLNSATPEPQITSLPDQVAARPSDTAAVQDPSGSTETSNAFDATSVTTPEQENSEGFTHIQASDVHDASDQFETIDKNELQVAGEQAVDDDLGSPWPDQNAAASTVTISILGDTDNPKEGEDDVENSAEAILEKKEGTVSSEGATSFQPIGGTTSTESSKKTQVDTPALEPSTSPPGNTGLVEASTSSSDGVTSVPALQLTELAESEPNARLESPAVTRIRANGLERDVSQASDSQTEDGGDVSNADGGEDNNGKALTNRQRKRLKEKEKKKQEAAAKKLREEQEAKERKAAEEAEAARTVEKREAEKKRQAEEEALARREEAEKVAALEAKKAADAEERKQATAADKQRLQQQQQTRQASSGGSVRNAQLSRQQGGPWQQHPPAIRTQPQVTTNPKSFKQDLEAGPNPSPVGSPRARSLLRAHSDIESQNRVVRGSPKERSESPSSTTSKDSSLIAGVASTAAGLWKTFRG